MSNVPSISIVIPAHNEENFLDGLLQSLEKYLAIASEIVVVNNGSTDNTSAIAKKYGCVVLDISRRQFPSKARNLGAQKASGDLLVFLDADVTITEKWGQSLSDLVLSQIANEDFLGGAPYEMSSQPSWVETNWFEPLRRKTSNYINGGNLLMTKGIFEKINGFDSNLETGEDVDFCKRAVKVGAYLNIDDKWKAHHEGFPKTFSGFIKREAWHGKGDFQSLALILNSKIAIITLAFLTAHTIFVFSLAGAILQVCDSSMYAFIGFVLIIIICMLSTVVRFKDGGQYNLMNSTLISYFYFLGRSISIIRVIADKIIKKFAG